MKRLVVWGGQNTLESHRHIHRGFFQNARKMGIDARWVADEPGFALHEGDTVLAANIWSKHLPVFPGVDYVLHNFDGSDRVVRELDPEQILRLQVWTTDAFGEEWDPNRQYDRENRILFQPWGTDLLTEEFMEPVFNPQNREVVFVGAVWSDLNAGVELGNEETIAELKQVCRENGLSFKHLTQISERQMIDETRAARLAPTLVGHWQQDHGYLPCRAFKHASYGVPVFSNSPQLSELFGQPPIESVGALLEWALRIKRDDYLELARTHQRVVTRYTYREGLQAIERALEEGRAGPVGAPFLDWKARSAVPAQALSLQAGVLRDLTRGAQATMVDAALFLDQVFGAVELLHEAAAMLKVNPVGDRARDWLRHHSSQDVTAMAVRLREQVAKIEAGP